MSARATREVFVALGSNLGDSHAQLRAARRAIARVPQFSEPRASSLYATEAIGNASPQPDYLNAVLAFHTTLCITSTWRTLSAIEAALGRVRSSEQNAARTIDIDLILFAEQQYASQLLTVPHPRFHLRAFVLKPLAEIAPAINVPRLGLVAALLEKVSSQRCERVAESSAWI